MTDPRRPGADDAVPGESDTELDSSEGTPFADDDEASYETTSADEIADDVETGAEANETAVADQAAVGASAGASSRGSRGQPAAGRRGNRRTGAPVVPVAPAVAPRPDELPYIDDRLDKVWVGLIFVIFGAIIFAALAFGNGGFLTQTTPKPSFAIETEAPTEPLPSETAGPSSSASGSIAPSGSPAPSGSSSPSSSSAPVSTPSAAPSSPPASAAPSPSPS